MEVAIVDAVAVAAEGAGAVQLFGGVDFAEDVELMGVGGGGEASELVIRKGSGDEEDGVGVMGAGFDDLILVDDEVLAKAREVGGSGGDFEVAQAALEKGLVGEDGERGRAGALEGDCEGFGVEVRTDEATRGGGFFELGDDSGGGSGGGAKSAGESARSVRGGTALEIAERRTGAALGEAGAGLSEDAVQVGQNGAPGSSIAMPSEERPRPVSRRARESHLVAATAAVWGTGHPA